MKWNVSKKITIGYMVALAILLIIGAIAYQNIDHLRVDATKVNATYDEIDELTHVILDLTNMETGQRGYVITGSNEYLEPFNLGRNEIDDNLKLVRSLVSHDMQLKSIFEDVENLVTQEIALLESVIDLRRELGYESVKDTSNFDEGKSVMDDIRAHIDEMQTILYAQLETQSSSAEEDAANAIKFIVSGIVIAFVVLISVSFVITRNITIPLKETMVLANMISNGDLSGDVTFSNRTDEIGLLSVAFSEMIESLSASAEIASKIADGDLNIKVNIKSEKDIMGNALSDMVASLKDMAVVADRIATGDLSITFKPKSDDDVMGNALYKMVDSLIQLAEIANQIAIGNLAVAVNPKSDNDVMGNALEMMVSSLRGITSEIMEGVNVIASASSEIMASTAQVASSATETASAINETSASVDEVKQSSLLANDKVKIVSQATQDTVSIAENGIKAVEKSIYGMTRIQEQVESIAQSLIRLSEQSQAIGEIIASVNDLAEQSNLLAVNAAIEAAKAGDQGKGFAVVAQEVKVLAEQSKEATGQVRSILNDIMKATNSAVMATEQGSKAVELGVVQSKEAGETIRQMADHIENAAQSALQISVTSQQQMTGMDQIAMAMDSIRKASEQNVTGTRQVESTVQNLHDLGQRLKHTVERFKVTK
jgi:methyl-accepting chemotaxis protein